MANQRLHLIWPLQMKIFSPSLPISAKFCVAILLSALISIAHAEDFFVPLDKFGNDSQKLSPDTVLEFWGYHEYDGSENYQNTLKLRLYTPLEVGDWRGRFRLDTSVASDYNSTTSPNNAAQFTTGPTLITVWGQNTTFFSPMNALVGGRIVFPFGNNNQWAVGPQLSWSYTAEIDSMLHVSDFSPLIRYMYGFCAKNNNCTGGSNSTPLKRSLELYPTIGIRIGPSTMLRFLDENGIIYNSAGGGWFVPIDAMITHSLSKNFEVAVGASKQVVQTFQQYDWMVYGKVSWNFQHQLAERLKTQVFQVYQRIKSIAKSYTYDLTRLIFLNVFTQILDL